MTEWDDQLPKFPVLLGPTTCMRRKREYPHCALHSVAKSRDARVVRRIAGQLALDDVFLEALDVRLERDRGDHPIPDAHPVVR